MFSRDVDAEPYGDLDRELLQALGLLVVNFAWLEDIVARAIAEMLARDSSWTAAHLLVRKVNFHSLIDLFGGVCRERFGNEYELYVTEVCLALERLGARRNELVHSLWDAREVAGGFSVRDDRLTRRGLRKREATPTKPEIEELAREIEKTYFGFADFILEHIIPANRSGDEDEPH